VRAGWRSIDRRRKARFGAFTSGVASEGNRATVGDESRISRARLALEKYEGGAAYDGGIISG